MTKRTLVLIFLPVLWLSGGADAAFGMTAAVEGTALKVRGDDSGEKVALRLSGTTIQVDFNDDLSADLGVAETAVQSVVLRMEGGADQVRIDTSGGDPTNELPVVVEGGSGNDTIDTANGFDIVDGGAGNDLISSGQRFDTIDGGEGDDTFTWVPGDASDEIDGGGGSDVLDFDGSNASENMTLTRSGERIRLFRDVASVDQDTIRVEHLDLRMLGGTDTFTAATETGALMSLTIDAGTSVAGQKDTITAGSGNDVIHGGEGEDTINGGGGDDDLFGDDGIDALDGGDGADVCVGETETNCEFDLRPPPPAASGGATNALPVTATVPGISDACRAATRGLAQAKRRVKSARRAKAGARTEAALTRATASLRKARAAQAKARSRVSSAC